MRFQSYFKFYSAIVAATATLALLTTPSFAQTTGDGRKSAQPVKVIDQDQKFQDDALNSINWARTKPGDVAAHLEKEMLPLFYTDQPINITVNRVDSKGTVTKVTEQRYPRYASVQEIRGSNPELFKPYTDEQIVELRRFFVETSGKPLSVAKMRDGCSVFRAISNDDQLVQLFQTLGSQAYIMNTKEGKTVVLETIQFLKTQRALKPLSWNDYLAQKAKEMVLFSGAIGKTGHEREDGKQGWSGWDQFGLNCIGENLAYGSTDLNDAVVGLIVDDGVKDRGHRLNIYSVDFTDVGIAMGEHRSRFNIMCVQDFGCSAETASANAPENLSPQVQNRPMMSPQGGQKTKKIENTQNQNDASKGAGAR